MAGKVDQSITIDDLDSEVAYIGAQKRGHQDVSPSTSTSFDTKRPSKTTNIMDPAVFADTLARALHDPGVQEGFRKNIIDPSLHKLYDTIQAQNSTIARLEHERDLDRKNHAIEIYNLKIEQSIAIDENEQYSRRNAIRISGIPDVQNPNSENTNETLRVFFKRYLNVDVEPWEFCRSHRLKVRELKNGQSHPIICKFYSYQVKERVMKARRALKNTPAPTEIDPRPTPSNRISVNDDLTKMKSQTAFEARDLKRRKEINDTWVYDGKVMIKLKNDQVRRVKHPSEFLRYGLVLPVRNQTNIHQRPNNQPSHHPPSTGNTSALRHPVPPPPLMQMNLSPQQRFSTPLRPGLLQPPRFLAGMTPGTPLSHELTNYPIPQNDSSYMHHAKSGASGHG